MENGKNASPSRREMTVAPKREKEGAKSLSILRENRGDLLSRSVEKEENLRRTEE